MPNISAASCSITFPAGAHPAPIAPTPSFIPQRTYKARSHTGTWVSVLEVPPIEVLEPLSLKEDAGKKVVHPSICSYLPQRVQQCGKLPGEAAPKAADR